MNRTGIHNTPSRATGGAPAPVRDCAYYGCRGNGWHQPDCPGSGMYRVDPRLAQKPDGSAPQKRLKRRSSEVD